jgi:AcrR family transcriptional regulator
MTPPSLAERRRAQTRLEIARSARELFVRDGYENVSAQQIAEECGVTERTFYRYFSSKDEVLSPIITSGAQQLAEQIAARPVAEDLATAVQRGYEQVSGHLPPADIQTLIALLIGVPDLRARWLADLRTIEDAVVPVVKQRAREPMSDGQAHITAASIVTALRAALEHSAKTRATEPLADTLGQALRYVSAGANLRRTR